MADIIGSSLGKYDILEELGRGGFGAVYRVRNRDLEREEALKVLGQHRQWDPTFVRRFQREARAAARLRHPHIVTIYEVGETEGTHFLAMEYLPGHTLAQLIAKEGALPPTRVSRIIAQVAEALDYAHAQGLVHRDVKPSNVMVGPGDDVTLMDFGLVKAADHSELSQELYSSAAGFTTAASAMGTPEYMAPELAEPNAPAADYRADIYSLGVVAYQALTGHLPFSAPTPVAVLRAHLDLAPPPLTQWVAALPAPVSSAVLRALAKNPAERYPSAGGFAAALVEAAQRADGERARAEKVAALYASAQEALDGKNWAAALAACGQVMALDANYRDVGALFDRANLGLAKQREWEAQQEEMAEQYDQGLARLAEGKWDLAIAHFQPLVAEDQVFRDADRKLAEATAAQKAEAAQKQERIARLYAKALAAYRTAKDHMAEILALQPDWRDPTGALDRLLDLPAPISEAEVEAKVETRARVEEVPGKPDAAPGSRLPWKILGPAMACVGMLLAIWGVTQVMRPAPTPQVIERVVTQPAPTAQVIERIVTQPAPTAVPTLDTAVPQVSSVDGMAQLYVPAGEFVMGSADDEADAYADEKPRHKVALDAYWIDRTEVTKDQYQQCVAAGKCAVPGCGGTGQGDHPVVCVSWQDAANYCAWAGRRLPTEAEWEKAARGTDGRKYPWGNEAPNDKRLNYAGNVGTTSAVGSYPTGAGPYEALDMAGNVWEWVADWYAEQYYDSSRARNPVGPDSGTLRVLRGGAWSGIPRAARTAHRGSFVPDSWDDNTGFRCSRSD